MKTSQFSFDLPEDQIAQTPPAERDAARLLVLDKTNGGISHSRVRELPGWIEAGTLVVLNDTRVRKARIFGIRAGGGSSARATEFVLLERKGEGAWEAIAGRAGRLTAEAAFEFPERVTGVLSPSVGGSRLIRFTPPIDEEWLERHGHVPLPPYIRRPDQASDAERYQTVYARTLGSAAAPTAGLHFTPRLLDELRTLGAEIAWVTLHVGLGTFQPIRAENIEDHAMHEEQYSVPAATKRLVDGALDDGRPVLAVGTTVVRTLESAWGSNGLQAGEGRTGLFIKPGYQFRVVSRLFTNFHTPGSSLLVLVSAFAGTARILAAYREAVASGYRFFSYGDAMLIR